MSNNYDPPSAVPEAGNPLVTATDSVTATGSTSAGAYAITKKVTIVTTAAASTGVRLPMSPGHTFDVVNLGASDLKVYPPTGGAINGGSADAALTIKTVGTADFGCASFFIADTAGRVVRTSKA